MKRLLVRTVALALCLAGLPSLPMIAQETPGALPGVFSEVLDVRVVNLEVVVTDKDGIPVVGLQPRDFLLSVDGEEIPIDYFSEIRGGVATGEAPEETKVSRLPALVPGEPVETSYLVFIDEFFSIARDRDRVLQALLEDLPRMGPQDRMAIVAYNGKQLEMLTTWTGSVAALERTLERALERPTYGLQRLTEQRQFDFDEVLLASSQVRSGFITADRFLRTDLTPNERFYVERLSEQVQRSVTAAASTLRSFARPPGRKVMLLYSGGWPYFPTSFLGSNLSPVVLASEIDQGEGLFRLLTDTANLLGYTIYPVDVPGFSDLLSDGASRSTSADFIGSGAAPDTGLQRSSFLRQQEVQYTLHFIAEETGGRALIDARRLRAFEEVVSDTRSYYWLGFTPERDWDDRRHRVELVLRERGLRIRSRRGYLDSSQQHEVAMALESSLLFGHPPGADAIGVVIGEAKSSGRRRMEVPVAVLIPLSKITFLPSDGQRVAHLELRVAVRDTQGRRADIPVVPVVIRVDDEPEEGALGRYETFLRLRRQPHEAVIAVYDPASGRILSASTEIAP